MSPEPEVVTEALPEEAAPRGPLHSYRELRKVPGFWRMVAIGMASKLPSSMVELSLLLLVGRAYSYGTAGLAVACLAIGQCVTAPLRGRLIDRYSPRAVLLGCLAGYTAATVLVILTASGAGSAAAVLAFSTALGATSPPVAVLMRTVWHNAAERGMFTTAMALDSAMMGTALVTGPVLASWLSLSFSGTVPLIVIAVLTAVVVFLLLDTEVPPRPAGRRHWLGPLTSAPLRRLLIADGLFVLAVTATDVLLPIYAKEHGAAVFTGAYLSALSIGSVLGSLALGAMPGLLARGPKLSVLLLVFAAGGGALALGARLSPVAVLFLSPVAGLVLGSVFGTLRTVGSDLAKEGEVTETMSWLTSLDMAGGAVGAAVFAHLAVTEGSGTALALVPAVVLLSALAGWTARSPSGKQG
ncbi:MFS transporter [Streptomyces sp. NPDC018019]|uniref:MFS transporter n=1 Tax=Streptomyces sp. NPDC018019 TaxID=3365030 RepID=UPI0037BAF9CC